ncbi:hypothetical protein EDD17DRAFT_1616778 [Pisolithus thermaeus]|nr:hypothetical protein EV401DRAFT_1900432 [Pisolithus croceorrhizus]KAI6158996.1 hypothetical protein EDD17DRAFT_1616778 [Pisolithus thermaeus]
MKQTGIIIRSNVNLVAFTGKEQGSSGSKAYGTVLFSISRIYLHIMLAKNILNCVYCDYRCQAWKHHHFCADLLGLPFSADSAPLGFHGSLPTSPAIYGPGLTIGFTANWIRYRGLPNPRI